jgi:DNA-binding FadR family transcriptional regulator
VSPGATFERVYQALKAQLRAGGLPAGARLEPAQLCEDLISSVTPVRDALHRLAGERIVEASPHDGFRVPLITELRLRQLYGFQEELLTAIVRAPRGGARTAVPVGHAADSIEAIDDLFLRLSCGAGNGERTAALANLLDRLGPVRRAEDGLVGRLDEEAATLRQSAASDDSAALKLAIRHYHRRRVLIVPTLVAALQRGP